MRRFIACCDTCQRVKFPNRAITTEERSHLPIKPGPLFAVNLFGSLSTSRGVVKYILMCYDVFFSKHVTLYPLKAATTRACLNKLINHYFLHVIKPEVMLSDNCTQFHSPSWKRNLESLDVQVRYTTVRHPQSNPSERCMKEISKFFRIYCSDNHRKWAELIPHIESWLNNTVASATGITPAELMFGGKGPNIFEDFLPEAPEGEAVLKDLQTKIAKAYEKMIGKIDVRKKNKKKGKVHWKPKVNDKVLLMTQQVSDATAGVTAKFLHPYERPYVIAKVIPSSTFELADENARFRGQFSNRLLRASKEASKGDEIATDRALEASA